MKGSASRAYKLKLSPAGLDLLIECHCRLIRAMRALLPYGTTLHVALHSLERVPSASLREDLDVLPRHNLAGDHIIFVGAPKDMAMLASQIVGRLHEAASHAVAPSIAHIHLVALQRLRTAHVDDMAWAMERCRTSAL